jgi:hypothetical protein
MRTVEIPWSGQPGALRLRGARITHLPLVTSRSVRSRTAPPSTVPPYTRGGSLVEVAPEVGDPLRNRRHADAGLRRSTPRRRGGPAGLLDERRRGQAVDYGVRRLPEPGACERAAGDAARTRSARVRPPSAGAPGTPAVVRRTQTPEGGRRIRRLENGPASLHELRGGTP